MKCGSVPTVSFSEKPSENSDMWVRVVSGASRGRVQFGSGSCTSFTFGFGSVLSKTWVLV